MKILNFLSLKDNFLIFYDLFMEENSDIIVKDFLEKTFKKYNFCDLINYKELYKINKVLEKFFGDKEKVVLRFKLSQEEMKDFEKLLELKYTKEKKIFELKKQTFLVSSGYNGEENTFWEILKDKIKQLGYTKIDLEKNIAFKIENGKEVKNRIDTILKKHEPILLQHLNKIKEFNGQINYISKKEEEDKHKITPSLKIIISRNPFDIARQSTGQLWASCKNLANSNFSRENAERGPLSHVSIKFLSKEIFITFIAYLLFDDSTNSDEIKNPIARVLIIPYLNLSQEMINNFLKYGALSEILDSKTKDNYNDDIEHEKRIILNTIKNENNNFIVFDLSKITYGISLKSNHFSESFKKIDEKFRKVLRKWLFEKQKDILKEINKNNIFQFFKLHPFVYPDLNQISFFRISSKLEKKIEKLNLKNAFNIIKLIKKIKDTINKGEKDLEDNYEDNHKEERDLLSKINNYIELKNFNLKNIKSLGNGKELWRKISFYISMQKESFINDSLKFNINNLVALECDFQRIVFKNENLFKKCKFNTCYIYDKAKIIDCSFTGSVINASSKGDILIKNLEVTQLDTPLYIKKSNIENLKIEKEVNSSKLGYLNIIECNINNFKFSNFSNESFNAEGTYFSNGEIENCEIAFSENHTNEKNFFENTKIEKTYLENNAILNKCELYSAFFSNCEIKDSKIFEQNAFFNCEIISSSKIKVKNCLFSNSKLKNLILEDCFWELKNENEISLWDNSCIWEKGYILLPENILNKINKSDLRKYNLEFHSKKAPFSSLVLNTYIYTTMNPVEFMNFLKTKILSKK